MFGYVNANIRELSKPQRERYNAVYCGICREIHAGCGSLCRLGLSYDMTFLALLLMSLYEPEEASGPRACALHPIRPKRWVSSPAIAYAADVNVALAYYQSLDKVQDDGSLLGKAGSRIFGRPLPEIEQRLPRQCRGIREALAALGELERENCPDPDRCANLFGALLGEVLVYREDLWEPTLRQLGLYLGRFIYLADAMADYRRDAKKGSFNPLLAAHMEPDAARWDEILVLAMARATREFEKLPLVQDKAVLDNILYSGVWCSLPGRKKEDGA